MYRQTLPYAAHNSAAQNPRLKKEPRLRSWEAWHPSPVFGCTVVRDSSFFPLDTPLCLIRGEYVKPLSESRRNRRRADAQPDMYMAPAAGPHPVPYMAQIRMVCGSGPRSGLRPWPDARFSLNQPFYKQKGTPAPGTTTGVPGYAFPIASIKPAGSIDRLIGGNASSKWLIITIPGFTASTAASPGVMRSDAP